MVKKVFVCIISMFLVISVLSPNSFATNESNSDVPNVVSQEQAQETISSSQYFTENKGQWNPSIKYMGNTSFGRIAFTDTGVCYEMQQEENSEYITLSFVNPISSTLAGTKQLVHKNNYMFGDQEDWAIGCKNYTTITYTNVWNGIDLSYTFTNEGLKYEYYVSPEANLNDLQVKVTGANITENGKTLKLETTNQNSNNLNSSSNSYTPITLLDDELYTYTKESKQELKSYFVINENNIYSFQIEDLPEVREETIVIDPVVYSTYIGGTKREECSSICTDDEGNAYITGYTYSYETDDFPICPSIPGAYKIFGGYIDAFVMKLSNDGSELLYATYIGGTGTDGVFGIDVDKNKNAYIAGYTMSSEIDGFPICPSIPGPYKTYDGSWDSFVMKLSSDGSKLLYATYIGGTRSDVGCDVVLDELNNAYIVGYTESSKNDNFSICPHIPGYDKQYNGGSDIYVVKLCTDGSQLLYSTYLGGFQNDWGYGIAINSNGEAYITGEVASSETEGFPICPNVPGPYKTYNGVHDAYIIKLSNDGSNILFSTYIGGLYSDIANEIAVDQNGNACIVGFTNSDENLDFPICPSIPGPYKTFGGNIDTFVVKISCDGSRLLYSTYLGGEGDDEGRGIAFDSDANAYITGLTSSSETQGFPICPSLPGPYKTHSGLVDAYLIKLSSDGSKVLFSTYVGGFANDAAYDVAVGNNGYAYIVGPTESSENLNFPICPSLPGPYKTYNGGNGDGFVMKLSTCPPPTLLAPVNYSTNVVIAPTLKWEGVSGSSTYQLEILKNNVCFYTSTGITNTQFNVPNGILDFNTEYQWRVKGSTSLWSQPLTFTTLYSPADLHISATSNGVQ